MRHVLLALALAASIPAIALAEKPPAPSDVGGYVFVGMTDDDRGDHCLTNCNVELTGEKEATVQRGVKLVSTPHPGAPVVARLSPGTKLGLEMPTIVKSAAPGARHAIWLKVKVLQPTASANPRRVHSDVVCRGASCFASDADANAFDQIVAEVHSARLYELPIPDQGHVENPAYYTVGSIALRR